MVTFALACVHVLLLTGPGVLEPHLGDPLGEACDLSDSLEVLSVGVAVQLEVGLEDLELLLREGGPDPLRLALAVVRLRVSSLCPKSTNHSH